MTPKQISLVQESWQKVLPIAPQAAEVFYKTLFDMDPSLKPLFPIISSVSTSLCIIVCKINGNIL